MQHEKSVYVTVSVCGSETMQASILLISLRRLGREVMLLSNMWHHCPDLAQ